MLAVVSCPIMRLTQRSRLPMVIWPRRVMPQRVHKSNSAAEKPQTWLNSSSVGRFCVVLKRSVQCIRSDLPLMNTERMFRIPLIKKNVHVSLSDIAGHCSFILLAWSYAENDVLRLRALATTGILLAIVFQFFRPRPLWIPIRWNFLFVAINIGMISTLVVERRGYSRLAGEQKQFFEKMFDKFGNTKDDFIPLISSAQLQRLERGEYFTRDGKPNDKLFVVVEGKAVVKKSGEILAYVTPSQFIGELGFLSFVSPGDDIDQTSGAVQASADVIADTTVTCYVWNFEELERLCLERPGIGKAMHACISCDLATKVQKRWNTLRRRNTLRRLNSTAAKMQTPKVTN